jgi:SH2 domain
MIVLGSKDATGLKSPMVVFSVKTVSELLCFIFSWYHGPLGRVEAEELLRQQPQGSFLVRQSESNKMDYSLSLK